MKILIVEDDQVIAKALKKKIIENQLEARIVEDFEKVIETFDAYQPHLVLLDIHFPYFNGYYWCGQIRAKSTVPIIFISSRSEQMDQLMAIQMGADDYITKPIDMPLTMAKIQALLRRAYDFQVLNHGIFSFGQVTLDPAKAVLKRGDFQIDLTAREVQVMSVLFKNGEKYSSREEILDECWQNGDFIDDNTLAVNISRLRKKLKTIHLDHFIETKKGLGYRLKGEEV